MTEHEMIREYIAEIRKAGGITPEYKGRESAMQIAKLQDAWRKLQ